MFDNNLYFYKEGKIDYKIKPELYIEQRKHRKLIKNSWRLKQFFVGDIIEILFFLKNIPLIFSGICISIKRKNFIVSDVIIIIRNMIMKVSIEITVSYYYNRIYKLKFLDFRRKIYTYAKSKMYYIRKRVNQESRVGQN
jgi:ribosomal protein L19